VKTGLAATRGRDPLLRRVLKTCRDNSMFGGGGRVILAVSGGADSVAMTLALHALSGPLRVTPVIAHLDHRLRGGEAEEDARFVAAFAESLGIACCTGRADVRARAKRARISIEMAAREARYRFLADTARGHGAAVIATAHTADDQAETVILRLARGAGPGGLAGIAPVSERDGLRIVRPLLDTGRREVEAFLARRRQVWREDRSNADPVHLRNRVRREVMPLLRDRLNPSVCEAICRGASIARCENAFLDAMAGDALAACRAGSAVDAARMKALPEALRRRVLRRWLCENGIPAESLDFESVERADRLLCAGRGSSFIELPGGLRMRRAYNSVSVGRRGGSSAPAGFSAAVSVPGTTILPDAGLRVEVSVAPGIARARPRGAGSLPAAASLSLARLGRRKLVARSWRPGDRLRPLGLGGSRKLQDLFTDAKVPASRRPSIPVFACGREIVWVPGCRIGEGWQVASGTEPALQIRVRSNRA